MPIDYSKWKKIEVSDDEDDTHPNVDTPSLYRWRHQARVERMEDKKKQWDDVSEAKSKTQRQIAELQRRLADASLDSDREKLTVELTDLQKQEKQFLEKEAELEKQERLEPWNVDTIAHEGFSKSRINKVQPQQHDAQLTEDEKHEKAVKFWKDNKKLINEYAMLRKWDDTKQFLLDNHHLCCENTANYLTIECLNKEIADKHGLMEHMAHQTIVMNFLLELAKELKYSPQAPQLISMFFDKLKKAEKTYQDAFDNELCAFKDRIVKRAKEKIDEAVKKYEEEERKKRLGPGGLDPIEVLETLPEKMRACFENQDIGGLQTVAAGMPTEEFRNHLKRCVDSGLWLPEGNSGGAGDGPSTSDETQEVELRQRTNAAKGSDNID